MRKLLMLALPAIICFYSCNDTKTAGATDDTSQKNLDAARKIADAFKTGNTSAIDSVVAEDFVDHTDRGDMGRDSLKAMITFMHSKMGDMKMETIKELADNEHVFQWMRYTGTSDGSMGMPAGPYDMKAIEVSKFRDGKAIEHWGYMEYAEMVKMMSQGQNQQQNTMPMDTTAKTPAK